MTPRSFRAVAGVFRVTRGHTPCPDRARMPNTRRTNDAQQPELYEIRVRGLLGATLLEAFPDLSAHRRGRDTLLRGQLPDQSALYGVIHQLEALGLELLEVRTLGAAPRAQRKSHERVMTPHQASREPPPHIDQRAQDPPNKETPHEHPDT